MRSEKTIIDFNDYNKTFQNLYETVDETLILAAQPFCDYTKISFGNLLGSSFYDYQSLRITTLFSVLNDLAIEFSLNLPLEQSTKRMPSGHRDPSDAAPMNRERLKRIKKSYEKRNQTHLKYLNSRKEYQPQILAAYSLYYTLLSDYPRVKKFLFEEEAYINKDFFNELDAVYDCINGYKGYQRFQLFYKLEMDSKLEMFYKILALIKKQKVRYKLLDDQVQEMIGYMKDLHIFPVRNFFFQTITQLSKEPKVFDEISSLPFEEKTVNGIIFATDKIIEMFVHLPDVALLLVKTLSFIQQTVMYHLSQKIICELGDIDQKNGLDYIMNIQNCECATECFDAYLDAHNHIWSPKNPSKDITFSHFKKVYQIKKEPPKKN